MKTKSKKPKKNLGLPRHNPKSILVVLLAITFGVVGTLMLQNSFAAKPSSGTITVVQVSDANADGLPNYSEHITFSVATTATNKPFVQLDCYQSGTRVYGMSAGFFPDYPFTTSFTLRSDYWTGGAAECTARGYYFATNGRQKIFTTLNFTVNP
jgi:hypothetical protein